MKEQQFFVKSDFTKTILLFQEIIQDRDEERERLQKELDRTRTLLAQSAQVPTSSLSRPPGSRPASFISVEESSGPETASERNLESEDDGGKSLPV